MKLITLLMISLSLGSCKIATLEVTQVSYDDESETCFSRRYRYSRDYIGPITEFSPTDRINCDRAVGYPPEDYVRVQQWLEDQRSRLVGRD